MRVEYIDNKPLRGIKYDYTMLNKEFNKMMKKCSAPTGLYNPCTLPRDNAKWFVLMSERSSSKTTQMLLYSMLKFKYYGSPFAYVRKDKTQISRQAYAKLFEVITNPVYGYIKYLTNGKYNNIFVDRVTKECYFTLTDDNGQIVEQSSYYFCTLMSVDECERYASSFNTNNTDDIILDEFSRGMYRQNEFIDFCNIIATLRRDRYSVRIYLLSNTISPYDNYLRELGVASSLAQMKKGQHAIITSVLGAKVYCEMLDVGMHSTIEFKAQALEYFGFNNEQLRALYGGEWEIKPFNHLPHNEDLKLNSSKILFEFMGSYIRLAHFKVDKMRGLFLYPYTGKITKTFAILTDLPQFNTDNVNISNSDIIRKLLKVYSNGLMYFSDNETALQFLALSNSIITKK